MPPRFSDYRKPPDGSPESADPLFKVKVRPCGKCGKEFTTSAAFRYFCEVCRDHWAHRVDGTKYHRPTVRLGSSASNAYWKY